MQKNNSDGEASDSRGQGDAAPVGRARPARLNIMDILRELHGKTSGKDQEG